MSKVGQPAPDFTLKSHLHTEVSLRFSREKERRHRLFSSSLDTRLNEPDPFLRGSTSRV